MARIFIIDDDAVARLLLRHMLERDGHVVVEADSADRALEYLDGEPGEIDMIVCDYVMPGRNGLDVLDGCVQFGMGPPDIPFVLLTGVLRQDDLKDDRVELVSAYLTKPVSSGELEAVVSNLLDGSEATSNPPMPMVDAGP